MSGFRHPKPMKMGILGLVGWIVIHHPHVAEVQMVDHDPPYESIFRAGTSKTRSQSPFSLAPHPCRDRLSARRDAFDFFDAGFEVLDAAEEVVGDIDVAPFLGGAAVVALEAGGRLG